MADPRPDRPPLADITEPTPDLTESQLRARRAPASAELDWLAAHGDRNEELAGRVRDLRLFLMAVDKKLVAINETEFEPIPEPEPPRPAPAPAPAAAAPEPTPTPEPADPEPETAAPAAAPASETVAPQAATPAPADPAPEPVPAATPVASTEPSSNNDDAGTGGDGGESAGLTGLTDDAIEQAMQHLQAELANRELPAEGTGVVETAGTEVEVLEPGAHLGGAPILATAGSGAHDGVAIEGPTTLKAISDRMLNVRRLVHLMPAESPQRFNLYRTDKLKGAEVPRLGDDPDHNTRLLFHEDKATLGADSIAAAADFSICGDPTEITVRGCQLDSTTPFLDSIAGNTIGARECVVRWKRPLSVEDINPGPQLWTACNQENVDPADRTTWKPISADLPPCENFCTAEPFDTVLGLGITLNDQLCRPERIEEMNRWIEVFHAILLEQTALSIFDLQVGPQHHFAFDAASTAVAAGAGGGPAPQLGAMHALAYAVHALTSRAGIDRHTPNRGWWVAMHPSIAQTLAMDMWLAGETPPADMATAILDFMRPAGVERIVWTKDFGLCEGVLATGYQGNAFLCNFENCDLPTYTDPGTGCVAFGGGNNIPELVSDTRLRFFQPENWFHGSTFLVDYSLMSSAELVRQNRAEYFGERRDLLFKAANCSSLEFVLDVSNLCATGQRIRHVAEFACPPPTAGGNGPPPLAPGISGIGQPNPMTLPDQPDPDPTSIPQRTGVGGPNPSPPTASGTPVPGGRPVVP